MNLNSLIVFFADAAEQTAGKAGPMQEDPKAALIKMVGMVVIFGFVMYFLMIRPQTKQAKEHEAMIKTLKAGDKVVTNSGVIGVVIAVKEKAVTIRSADTKLEVLKTSVAQVTERGGETSAS
jgi:preprotein translocase subunit YajC